jgi:hypothetical protein
MTTIRFALALLFVLPSCCSTFAQIELSYTIRKTIVGATNAEILPGGRILIDDDSKISGSVVAEVRATSKNAYKFEAQKSLKEYATLIPLPDLVKEEVTTKRFLLVGEGLYVFKATSRVDDLDRSIEVLIGKPTPEPPIPPKPDDPDPPQPPQPVKSFRVLFVKESGVTLPADQTAISNAKAIRDYLTSKTTPEGGLAGFREYDPQQNVTNEQPTMKALWAATKSSVTTVPCVVVEVNGKATVLPYPRNTTDALRILKEYGGQ